MKTTYIHIAKHYRNWEPGALFVETERTPPIATSKCDTHPLRDRFAVTVVTEGDDALAEFKAHFGERPLDWEWTQ